MKILFFCLENFLFAAYYRLKLSLQRSDFPVRKLVLCLFYALCAFAIAFSLFLDGPSPG